MHGPELQTCVIRDGVARASGCCELSCGNTSVILIFKLVSWAWNLLAGGMVYGYMGEWRRSLNLNLNPS